MHEWMTIAEAAERLGVDRGTVYRMVKEKRLAAYQPAAKKQGKVVRRAEVEALAGMRTARDQENSLPNDAPTVTMQLLDLMQHPPTQVEWVVRWTEGDRHYELVLNDVDPATIWGAMVVLCHPERVKAARPAPLPEE